MRHFRLLCGRSGLALLYVIIMMAVMMVGMCALLKMMLYAKTAEAGITTRQSGVDAATACYNEFMAAQGGAIPASSFTSYVCGNGAVVSSTSTAPPYFLAITTSTP